MRQHSDSGSFFFCQDTRTAFPRYKQSNATTQTELLVEISSDDIIRTGNSLRFIPELDTSKSIEVEEKNQEPDEKTTVQEGNVLVDTMTDTLEEIQDYTDLQHEVDEKPDSNPLVEIPLSYRYMSNEEILNVLLNEDPDVSAGNSGKKNYLVIRNEGYKGMPIFEDGVVWKTQSKKSSKQSFAIDPNYNLSKIYKKGSEYYYKRLYQKQLRYELILPQPKSIITFQKVTIELEGNESYRRRISRIAEAPEDLGFLTTKCLVEYYMDITSVRKVSVADNQVNVTIPDCTKLKEMLYPGVSKEVPEFDATTLKAVKADMDDDNDDVNNFVVNNQESPENDNVYQEDRDTTKNGEEAGNLVKEPVITSYQYLNDDELLQVILDDEATVDKTKNYRVFTSNYNGFQRVDEFGIWQVSATTNLTFSVNHDDKCTLVIKKNGKYCKVLSKKSGKEYEKLFPQPKDLLVLQRCTFKLRDSNSFLKRETVVWSAPERWDYLLHKHVTEYCSEKSIIPKEDVDENGKTKLVILNRKLYPQDKAFQKELALSTADMNQKQNELMQMSTASSAMSNEEVLETLILDGTDGAIKNPNGRNYMVIRNEKANGKSRFFLKDGCAWDNRVGTSVNQTFSIDESNNLTGVCKQGGKYCMKKRFNRKTHWVPVNPQPKEIITLHKYWTALKSCSYYRKRITSVLEAPDRLDFLKSKALVEYYTMPYSSNINIPLKLKEMFKGRGKKKEKGDQKRNHQVKRKFEEMEDTEGIEADSTLAEDTDEWKSKLDDSQVSSCPVDEESEEVAVYLPVTEMYMSGSQIWDVLLAEEPVSSVFSGPHHQDFIVVTTDETGEEGTKSVPCQDGLAWDGCSFQCANQLFVLDGEKLGRTVMIRNGLYSIKRKEKKAFVYESLKPQPKDIVTIRRTWIKLKSMPWYKKRCSKIIDAPKRFSHVKTKTLIEYFKQQMGDNEFDDVALLRSCTESSSQERNKKAQQDSDQDMTETSEDEKAFPEKSAKTTQKNNDSSSKIKRSLASDMSKSLYDKPYFMPSDENRTYRSERLKNRQVKRLEISHQDEDQIEVKTEREDTIHEGTKEDVSVPGKQNAAGNMLLDLFSHEMMSTEESFQAMVTETTVSSVKQTSGNKNFVVVEVEKDAADRRKLLRDIYSWDSKTGTTVNQKYSLTSDNKLTYVIEREGKYYKKKRNNNKCSYVLFDPQPKELVTLHRYWVKGKNTALVKRVTTVTEAPERLSFLKSRVLIEYSTAPRLCFKSTV